MSIVKIGKPYTGTHKTTMPITAMRALGLKPGDLLNAEVVGNSVVFTPIAGPIRQDNPATGAEQTPRLTEVAND